MGAPCCSPWVSQACRTHEAEPSGGGSAQLCCCARAHTLPNTDQREPGPRAPSPSPQGPASCSRRRTHVSWAGPARQTPLNRAPPTACKPCQVGSQAGRRDLAPADPHAVLPWGVTLMQLLWSVVLTQSLWGATVTQLLWSVALTQSPCGICCIPTPGLLPRAPPPQHATDVSAPNKEQSANFALACMPLPACLCQGVQHVMQPHRGYRVYECDGHGVAIMCMSVIAMAWLCGCCAGMLKGPACQRDTRGKGQERALWGSLFSHAVRGAHHAHWCSMCMAPILWVVRPGRPVDRPVRGPCHACDAVRPPLRCQSWLHGLGGGSAPPTRAMACAAGGHRVTQCQTDPQVPMKHMHDAGESDTEFAARLAAMLSSDSPSPPHCECVLYSFCGLAVRVVACTRTCVQMHGAELLRCAVCVCVWHAGRSAVRMVVCVRTCVCKCMVQRCCAALRVWHAGRSADSGGMILQGIRLVIAADSVGKILQSAESVGNMLQGIRFWCANGFLAGCHAAWTFACTARVKQLNMTARPMQSGRAQFGEPDAYTLWSFSCTQKIKCDPFCLADQHKPDWCARLTSPPCGWRHHGLLQRQTDP